MREEEDPGDAESIQQLRDILDGGILDRAAERVERLLEGRPRDALLLRRLGEIHRQRGDLEGAAVAYRRLAEVRPGDAFVARVRALLDGRELPSVDALPVKHLRVRDFLPPERVEEVRARVRERRGSFEETGVLTGRGSDRMARGTRRSSHLVDLGDLREWFDGKVLALLPEAVRRLRLAPFEASVRSCKISVYHDGHFFRLHQDQATGPAVSRVLGFLWYFEYPPRRFEGGELLLYDRDPDTLLPAPSFTNLAPVHNSLVLLPSNCWHEVLPVRCRTDDWFAGRFTYSGWIHDEAMYRAPSTEHGAPSTSGS